MRQSITASVCLGGMTVVPPPPPRPPTGLDVSKALYFACPECCLPLAWCLCGLHGRLVEALDRLKPIEGTNENAGKA